MRRSIPTQLTMATFLVFVTFGLNWAESTAAPVTLSGTINYQGTYSADTLYVAVIDTVGVEDVTIVDLAAIAVGVRVAWTREAWRARWQARFLRLPVIGPLLLDIGTARIASRLAILVGGGVPHLQALAAGSRVLGSLPLRSAVEEAARLVREGGSLHRSVERHKLLPPIFIRPVASREASGGLVYMLEQAAKHQNLENERRIRPLTGILEPAIIMAMGTAVLLVALAILPPIIEMNPLVRRRRAATARAVPQLPVATVS